MKISRTLVNRLFDLYQRRGSKTQSGLILHEDNAPSKILLLGDQSLDEAISESLAKGHHPLASFTLDDLKEGKREKSGNDIPHLMIGSEVKGVIEIRVDNSPEATRLVELSLEEA